MYLTEEKMDRNFRNRKKEKTWDKLPRILVKILLFTFFAVLAIKVGTLAGDAVSGMDSAIIHEIDVENFKMPLNNSLPIIHTIYNSGDINISLAGEIQGLVERVFGFDLSNPLTVLNAQSSYINSYYNKTYLPKLAEQALPKEPDINLQPKPSDEPQPQITEEPTPPPVETPAPDDGTKLPEPASSITYEEDEVKPPPDQGIESYGKIVIQNQTKYKIDIDKLLKEPLKLKTKKKGPYILVHHTHTTESYVRKLEDINKKSVITNSRDSKYNVVRVGDQLADLLRSKYGFNVMHSGVVNDYDYNKSYVTAMDNLTRTMKANSSIGMVIDLHRDGLKRDTVPKLRTVKEIQGKNCAQVMFVVGSNSRLSHPQWQENLKLAIKLQDKLNSIAPGLARPILVSTNRYNQHASNGALIFEVGGDGNLMSECLESTKYLARAIDEVLNVKTK
jgi:stage II sporulation protein P